jgi:hypothetical protein
MLRFADEREAKQFAVELIQSEAERQGILLSKLERKMLYFSETGWTLPDMTEAAQKFENECNSTEFGKKIKTLTKRLQKRLESEDRQTLKAWSDALVKLSEGDHYLLVLTAASARPVRPRHDILKLWITALVVILIGGAFLALLPDHSGGPLAREKSAFVMWVVAAIVAAAFLLLLLIVGRQRANDLLGTLLAKIFGEPTAKHR